MLQDAVVCVCVCVCVYKRACAFVYTYWHIWISRQTHTRHISPYTSIQTCISPQSYHIQTYIHTHLHAYRHKYIATELHTHIYHHRARTRCGRSLCRVRMLLCRQTYVHHVCTNTYLSITRARNICITTELEHGVLEPSAAGFCATLKTCAACTCANTPSYVIFHQHLINQINSLIHLHEKKKRAASTCANATSCAESLGLTF